MVKNLKVVRFLNGEEIIGDVVPNDITSGVLGVVTVKNPLVILYDSQSGQVAVRPWVIFSTDESFELNQSNIVYTANPSEPLANLYNQATSKLALPQKPGLILPNQ